MDRRSPTRPNQRNSRKGHDMTHCLEVLTRPVRRVVGVLPMLLAISTLAAAQGVTGTVSGTVRDTQGGVIPGATVTLISEARDTRSAPVVTNAQGDFVFANVTAGTYIVQIGRASCRERV